MSARNWCFTLNNPDDIKDKFILWPDSVRYAIYQLEIGASGTKHLQGYVEFDKVQRLSAVKKVLPKAHWETRKGTREQARDYCMPDTHLECRDGKTKRETGEYLEGPWELGTFVKDGERTDLTKLKDLIKEGKNDAELLEEITDTTIKHYKALPFIRSAFSEKRNWQPEVHIRWGEAGSGKTRFVYEKYPNVWSKPDGDWFDGYVGEDVVLFDDFYGGIKYSMFLKLLDRYPMQVPVKGGFVNWKPKIIYITSNSPPEDWYANVEDKSALLRRINSVTKIGNQDYKGHNNIQNMDIDL